MQTTDWVDKHILKRIYMYNVKKSVDFTVKYLASGSQFFYRYFYGRLPVQHF